MVVLVAVLASPLEHFQVAAVAVQQVLDQMLLVPLLPLTYWLLSTEQIQELQDTTMNS